MEPFDSPTILNAFDKTFHFPWMIIASAALSILYRTLTMIPSKTLFRFFLLTFLLITMSVSESVIDGKDGGGESLYPITKETPTILLSTAPSDAPSLGLIRSDAPSDMPSDMPSKPPICTHIEYHPPRTGSSTKSSGKAGGRRRRRLVEDECSEEIISSGDNLSANLAATSSAIQTNPITAGVKVLVVGLVAWGFM